MIKRMENTVTVAIVPTGGILNVRCMRKCRKHLHMLRISIFQLLGRVVTYACVWLAVTTA